MTALTRDGDGGHRFTGELARTVGEYDNARGGYLVRGENGPLPPCQGMTPPGVDECFVHDFCVQPIIQDTGELERLRENHSQWVWAMGAVEPRHAETL